MATAAANSLWRRPAARGWMSTGPRQALPPPRPGTAGGGASTVWERILIVGGAGVALAALALGDGGLTRWQALREVLGSTQWAWLTWPALASLALTLLSLTWRLPLWLRYRPLPALSPRDRRLPEVTVVIPAYNEGRTVHDTIASLLASDYPHAKLHIICVDDGSHDDTATWARKAASAAPRRVEVLQLPANAGKRHALFAGFSRCRTAVIVTVDSDTVVARDAVRALVTPLALDPSVGAVAGRIDVLNENASLLTRMLAVRYRLGFDFVRAAQSGLGCVQVTPGAFSAYRRATIAPVLTAWRDVTFLGARCANGDDHHLANRVLWQGQRTLYQGSAVARTMVPSTYKRLALMYTRWARSNWRESALFVRHVGDVVRTRARLPGAIDGVVHALQLPLRLYLALLGWGLVALHPGLLLRAIGAALIVAVLHAAIYLRSRQSFDAIYALAYAVFALLTLQWIPPFALVTVRQARWLTR